MLTVPETRWSFCAPKLTTSVYMLAFHICLQETLKLMGVTDFTQTLAWFVEYLILMTLTVIFLTICLNVPVYVGKEGGEYSRSPMGDTDTSVLFAFLFLYAIASIMFSFALSSFFKKGEIIGCHGFNSHGYCMDNRYEKEYENDLKIVRWIMR